MIYIRFTYTTLGFRKHISEGRIINLRRVALYVWLVRYLVDTVRTVTGVRQGRLIIRSD